MDAGGPRSCNSETEVFDRSRYINHTLHLLTAKSKKEVRWSVETGIAIPMEKIARSVHCRPVDSPLRRSNAIANPVNCRAVDRLLSSISTAVNLPEGSLAPDFNTATCLPSNFVHQYSSAALLTHHNNSQYLTFKERRELSKKASKEKQCTGESSPPLPPIEVNFPNFSWVDRFKSENVVPTSSFTPRAGRNSYKTIPDWYWDVEAEKAAMAIPSKANHRHSKIGPIRKPNPYTEHIVPEAFWDAEAVRIGLRHFVEDKAESPKKKKKKSKAAKKPVTTRNKKDKNDKGKGNDEVSSPHRDLIEEEKPHLGFRQKLRAGWARLGLTRVIKFRIQQTPKPAPTPVNNGNVEFSPHHVNKACTVIDIPGFRELSSSQFNRTPTEMSEVSFRKRNSRTRRSHHLISELTGHNTMGKMTYRGIVERYD